MEDIIKIFKALGDETRVNILRLIANKNMCAKGIAKHIGVSEAAVSQQIKILKEVNLIIGYKVGYHIIYDINKEVLNNSKSFIDEISDREELVQWNHPDIKCKNQCKHIKCINNYKLKEEEIMKVCFPVKSNEGVKSVPYGHFGTAPLFIIINLENGEVRNVGNGDLGHEHGKCQPIKAISGETVDAVIVGGIGAGAINKLNSMGIRVYKAIDGNIERNLEAFKAGELKEFSINHSCNHDGCEHH